MRLFSLALVGLVLLSLVAAASSRPLREAPAAVAPEGRISIVRSVVYSSDPWGIKVNRPSQSDRDLTIRRSTLENEFKPSRVVFLASLSSAEEADRLAKEVNGTDGGAFCVALGLGLRIIPETAAVAPWVGGACTLITKALDAEKVKLAPRVGDTIWRYDELCAPAPNDKDRRLVYRNVYFTLQSEVPADWPKLANQWLNASEEERNEMQEDLPNLDGKFFFLKENRARVRVVD